ncbi:TetR/AcrR family transcriptional regulator [Nocardia sp. NBC_00565]|uniref:TetR/AcrR family transcriptional regulator n=1 Tax=Nocardia sp. NBC_00565 TaxID=2975993 RepID=UPI002E82249E|nr:TetR/AcrR family transcriptional regulator [Nocardia sp. NBC_00565]WUB99915.1 TetR/AcrR family transcriptional regulator [Nocardia sp. NBC_00565]
MSSVAPPGRGPKVRAAVLDAAVRELGEQGYAAFNVENVARRAGVHKTTVYRRWPERDALIADALAESVTAEIPIPDTGSIDTDLRGLARSLVTWLKSPGGQAVLAVLLSETAGSARPPDVVRHIFRDRIRQALPVVGRAVERGELPANTDAAELVKALVAPIYFRTLITREQVTDDTADSAARLALTGARAGLFELPRDR